MIDDPAQVDALITKMKTHLPISARGTGGLVRSLRNDGIKMTSRQVQIVDVLYFGDEGGILCASGRRTTSQSLSDSIVAQSPAPPQ